MYKLILTILTTVVLACGGGSSPVAPGGNDDDPTPTPVNSPVEGNWTVIALTIVGAEGDTMSQSSPNASGAAVFTATDADIDVSLFGQPTVDESGPYTVDTTAAVLTIQTGRGAKTWDYAVAGNVLTLEGLRSSGGEQVGVRITSRR